jgi:hypothetical protein
MHVSLLVTHVERADGGQITFLRGEDHSGNHWRMSIVDALEGIHADQYRFTIPVGEKRLPLAPDGSGLGLMVVGHPDLHLHDLVPDACAGAQG